MKKSFIIHLDSLGILDELTDEQAGKLLKAFRDFHNEIEPKLDTILRIVFHSFRLQFQRDIEKYEGVVQRNSLNGSKGGRPKKAKKSKQNQENPVGILALSENPLKPKKADSDSDSDSDNDSVKDIDFIYINSEKQNGSKPEAKGKQEVSKHEANQKQKFIKPTIEEISLYVQSKQPMADKELILEFAEKFHSFYESNGWRVGKNPMKNWRAAISTWKETLIKTLNPFKESSAKESFPLPVKKGSFHDRQAEYLKGLESILTDTSL